MGVMCIGSVVTDPYAYFEAGGLTGSRIPCKVLVLERLIFLAFLFFLPL